jgi:arylsulfatase A-like enzyme
MYEGGIREPLIIRLPGKTKPGSVNHSLITSPDFYPTILDLTKTPLVPSQHVDGQVVSNSFAGKTLKKRTLYWHYPHYGNQGGKPSSCIMEGDWKLIKWYTTGNALYELYNVHNDIGEKEELSGKYRKKTASMKKKLEAFLSEAGAKYPVANPNFK